MKTETVQDPVAIFLATVGTGRSIVRRFPVTGPLGVSRLRRYSKWLSISYAKPFRRRFNDDSGTFVLEYPIRFSAGVQQETFFNFTGGQNQQFRPYVQISLF